MRTTAHRLRLPGLLLAAALLVALLLAACGERKSFVLTEAGQLPRLLMADGALYADTGKPREGEGFCGTLSGYFTAVIDSALVPTADGQANFTGADGWQTSLENDCVYVYMKRGPDHWILFQRVPDSDPLSAVAGGVRLSARPLDGERLTLEIQNHTDAAVWFDGEFSLEQQGANGRWTTVSSQADAAGSGEESRSLPGGFTQELTVSLADWEELPSGRYRLVKTLWTQSKAGERTSYCFAVPFRRYAASPVATLPYPVSDERISLDAWSCGSLTELAQEAELIVVGKYLDREPTLAAEPQTGAGVTLRYGFRTEAVLKGETHDGEIPVALSCGVFTGRKISLYDRFVTPDGEDYKVLFLRRNESAGAWTPVGMDLFLTADAPPDSYESAAFVLGSRRPGAAEGFLLDPDNPAWQFIFYDRLASLSNCPCEA